MKERTDYRQPANHRLIAQVAGYYNEKRCDIETYRKLNLPVLEQLAKKHLMHWKRELRDLVFSNTTAGGEK